MNRNNSSCKQLVLASALSALTLTAAAQNDNKARRKPNKHIAKGVSDVCYMGLTQKSSRRVNSKANYTG
jgi:hypothetical protein